MREGAKLDKAELFRLLAYVPHRAQAEVHASTARLRIVASASAWGKTHLAVRELIAVALAPGPESRIWVAAPNFDVCDKFLEALLALLRGGLSHRIIEETRRGRRIVLMNLAGNRSIIEARATDRVSTLVGESLDFLVVEEAGRVSDDAWSGALSQRIVERDGRALIIGVPREEGSWFHKLFLEGLKCEQAEIASWSGPSVANSRVDPAVIERARARLSVNEFASEHEGHFVTRWGPLCLVCNGPPRGCRSVIMLEEGEELRECEACKRPLDRDGTPIGAIVNGVVTLTIIQHDPVAPPDGEDW